MKLIKHKISGRIAEIETSKGFLQLFIWGAGIVRCVYTKRETVLTETPLEIEQPEKGDFSWKSEKTEESLLLWGTELELEILKADCSFTWKNSDGKILLREKGKELTEIDVIKYSTGGEVPMVKKMKTVDGERNFVENLRPFVDRKAYKGKLKFNFKDGESIHGLGQGEEGIYNYRGNVQYLYQHNMRIPMPSFVSTEGYGIVANCGSLMTFNDDKRGSYLYFDTIDQLDYYFVAAENLDGIIGGFRKLTGKATLLPKWGYGYIQSKEAYDNQDELVAVGEKYRELGVPIDCVVQDWNSWESGKWGNKRLDPKRFYDLKKATEELKSLNIHTMVSVWPNLNDGCEDYEETKSAGFLLGDASTYNAFDPAARELFWKQANRELFSGGFDSWWCDSTEPFPSPDWSGEYFREPWERYLLVGEEHKKYLDAAKANLFALAHAEGIFENQRKETGSKKRVLNLTRSGYLGSQKYGTVLWSGDIVATWKVMKDQIAEGLNMSMSGHPWWTLDIGGFFVVKENWQGRGCSNSNNPNPIWFWQGGFEQGVEDYGYRELYTRWLQYGVFLPMFRSHGTDTPREIWNFGKKGDAFYDSIEKFINLRYELMPYIYSVAGAVAHKNYTFMRSLIFDFPEDETARDIGDQFLCGNALLICPITKPMYFEAENKKLEVDKTWDCYLPKGTSWYDFWAKEKLSGGQTIRTKATIDEIPIFVREGSIIPMEQSLKYASEKVDTPLKIEIYSGKDGEFFLYEDHGDNYDYEQGEYNFIRFNWNDSQRLLTIGRTEHDFIGSIKGRKLEVVLYGGGEKAVQRLIYNGEETKACFAQ